MQKFTGPLYYAEMAEKGFATLPQHVQMMVIAGLDKEISERTSLIERERNEKHPDHRSIQWWEGDIAASRSLRDHFLHFSSLDPKAAAKS